MIDYLVVSKSTVPMKTIMLHGEWIELLNKLDMDKSRKFEFDNLKRANSVRSSIQASFRTIRARKLNINYKVRSTVICNLDKTYTLYIWKEKKT